MFLQHGYGCYNGWLMFTDRQGHGLTSVKKIILLRPRGFCAGVVRAIDVVKIVLNLYGAPVYVRKEIVHNRHVVDELRQAGAIFVDELSEVPEGARVIFKFHARGIVGKGGTRELVSGEPVRDLLPTLHPVARVRFGKGPQVPGATIGVVGHDGAAREITHDVRAATGEPVGVRENDHRLRVVGARGDDTLVHGDHDLGEVAEGSRGGEGLRRGGAP